MILSIANQKGGVGKTTTAQALAAELNNQEFKTLLIDLDPQCNLTYSCGIDPAKKKIDISDLLERKETAQDAIIHAPEGDLIPGNYLLTDADFRFKARGKEYLLLDALKPIRDKYRYIVIDCPPTLGLLTTNAFAAADSVLIPLTAGMLSFQGIGQLSKYITLCKEHCNRDLSINGLLLTQYKRSKVAEQSKKQLEVFANTLGTKAYKTTIRDSVTIPESQIVRESVIKYAPRSNVALDYKDFVREFLKGEQ